MTLKMEAILPLLYINLFMELKLRLFTFLCKIVRQMLDSTHEIGNYMVLSACTQDNYDTAKKQKWTCDINIFYPELFIFA